MKHGTSTAATFVVLFVVVILLLVILLADAPSDKGPALDNEDKGTLAWQEDDRKPQKDPTADADADETQDGDEDEDEIKLPTLPSEKDENTTEDGKQTGTLYTPQISIPQPQPEPQQQTQQQTQTQQPEKKPDPVPSQPAVPQFVPRTIGSGSFRSSTGVNVNLVVYWSCTTTSSTSAELTLDVYVESYTLYSGASPGALIVSAYGTPTALSMPELSFESSSLVTNHVANKTYNITISDGASATVPVEVKWLFGGVYSGVSLPEIVASGDLNLYR